jgi:hypothetical protein
MKNERTSYLRFNINQSWNMGGYELYGCWDEPGNHLIKTVEPLIFKEQERSGLSIPPIAIMKPEDLQVVMDALWTAGIRPGCGEGHIGELNATKYHLEDMRKLVFERNIEDYLK